MSKLTHAAVSARLGTQRIGRSLTLLASTGSTNDDARRAASEGAPDGHVIIADHQTAGRGSRGRSWSSPPGTDLYVSVVLRVELPPARLPPLTLAVGLAIAEALEALLPASHRPEVKWPNDVWVGRRKVAGVLVEASSVGARAEPVVVGFGINVNRRSFPSDLAHPATSLAEALGHDLPRDEVLARVLDRLEAWVDRFLREGPAPLVAALAGRLALRGERARCDDVEGVVDGVAESGALVLRTPGGPRVLMAGTLRPCEGDAEGPA
ncbi:MAG: biotin--[acetyl-CoA-carboxylase] ligase [Polyangiales bacterium]